MRLSDFSVGRLLRKLDRAPQRSLGHARQRGEAKIEASRRDPFLEIQKRVNEVGAQIYFGDEASIRFDRHSGTTIAPTGKMPVVERSPG